MLREVAGIRSAPLMISGYASEVPFKHFAVQKSLVSFSDPIYLKSSVNSGSYYGSDRGVHAGRIASGSKDTDSFYLHKIGLQTLNSTEINYTIIT